ncbi:hypothetical protein GPS48_17635 [Acinetobacter haemolyticus]|nr:hypothetical protein [Acinetobacter haemolyticus]
MSPDLHRKAVLVSSNYLNAFVNDENLIIQCHT